MSFRNLLRKKVSDEKGSFSVEAILMFPMLIWAFMALYVFFEGLRETNINLKATYTVADLLSRLDTEVLENDVSNLNVIYRWLARSRTDTRMRMSVVQYREADNTHQLYCSIGIGVDDMRQEWVNQTVTPHVPIMADAATAIVVETWVDYVPIMDIPLMSIGLGDQEIYNIVVTAPRVADNYRCDGVGNGTGSTHNDQVNTSNTSL